MSLISERARNSCLAIITGYFTDYELYQSLRRRERNRMHAKMTRDRKKNFIATIEKTIDELESNNAHMKEVLARVVQTHFQLGEVTCIAKVNQMVPYPVTPESSSSIAPSDDIPPLHCEANFPPTKRFCHGFMLSSA